MAARSTFRSLVVSVLVIAALIAAAAVLVRRAVLRYEADIVTFVDDSAGIAVSSPVLLHGIPVGHVRRIALSGSAAPNRTVRIDMRFDRAYLSHIPDDSTIAIVAANLLGDKSLDISRGVSDRHLEPGAEIHSRQTEDIGSLLLRGAEPLKKVDSVLDRVDRIMQSLDQRQGSAGLMLNDTTMQRRLIGVSEGAMQIGAGVTGTVPKIQAVIGDIDKPLARWKAIAASFGGVPVQEISKDADAVMTAGRRLQADTAKDTRFADALKNIQQTEAKAGGLSNPKGTLGLLLGSTELSESLKRSEAEFEAITAEIGKHPTRFFEIRFGLF